MNLLDPSLWWVFALIAIDAVVATVVINWVYTKTIGEKKQAPEGTWIFVPKQGNKD
jgi:hypothetical protein